MTRATRLVAARGTAPRARRVGRLTLVVAAATVVTVSLSGCLQMFFPPRPETTSTPTGEQVAAELQPFYSQQLVWSACGDGMQCTTAEAPMNWEDPAADTIELALVRQPATGGQGGKKGSLLINPGGPGGSGYEFVLDSVDYAVDERLQQNFDIVGFDPRGVGRSTPVTCYDDPSYLDGFLYDIVPGEVGSDEWIANIEAVNTDFGAECLKFTGPSLQFVDTVSAARDMDLLRAILGDEKLNFLGYSYGTFLGATYADLYPQKTGRLVLDGAIDPSTTDFEVTLTQAKGFDSALRAYLTDCVQGSDCPFRAVDSGMEQIAGIFHDLSESPLPGSDGREFGVSAMFAATILPLYNQDNWPYLNQLFEEVTQGETDTGFLLADSYNERNPDGSYASNSTEAFYSINCLDYEGETDVAKMREEAAQLAAEAPVFGPWMAYGGTTCAGWPFPPSRVRDPITAEGSADILVVGTTNDPATPYVWAQALAEQLENGHLITYTGEGHTAYNKSNACVNDAVDDYFVDGTVPDSDPDC
jgi:pimeloyl-ACP methyl ester carboxylesterase